MARSGPRSPFFGPLLLCPCPSETWPFSSQLLERHTTFTGVPQQHADCLLGRSCLVLANPGARHLATAVPFWALLWTHSSTLCFPSAYFPEIGLGPQMISQTSIRWMHSCILHTDIYFSFALKEIYIFDIIYISWWSMFHFYCFLFQIQTWSLCHLFYFIKKGKMFRRFIPMLGKSQMSQMNQMEETIPMMMNHPQHAGLAPRAWEIFRFPHLMNRMNHLGQQVSIYNICLGSV